MIPTKHKLLLSRFDDIQAEKARQWQVHKPTTTTVSETNNTDIVFKAKKVSYEIMPDNYAFECKDCDDTVHAEMDWDNDKCRCSKCKGSNGKVEDYQFESM